MIHLLATVANFGWFRAPLVGHGIQKGNSGAEGVQISREKGSTLGRAENEEKKETECGRRLVRLRIGVCELAQALCSPLPLGERGEESGLRYFFSTTQMLQYCSGLPWPWRRNGPGVPSGSGRAPPVTPLSSWSWWMYTPLCLAVRRAFLTFLPSSATAQVNSTS